MDWHEWEIAIVLNLGGGGVCSNGVSHPDLWLRRPQGGAAGERELGAPEVELGASWASWSVQESGP